MGVEVIKIREGDNINFPKNGQVVRVHFECFLENGNRVSSSKEDSKPFSFVLGDGEVIKAWDFAIGKMSLGEKITF